MSDRHGERRTPLVLLVNQEEWTARSARASHLWWTFQRRTEGLPVRRAWVFLRRTSVLPVDVLRPRHPKFLIPSGDCRSAVKY